MQVKMKGLKKVTRKLKDGSSRVHYYAWVGGPKMRAAYGTTAFAAEFQHHHEMRDGKFPKTLTGYMLELYLASPEGQSGAPSTVSERQRYIAAISDRFGKLPLKAFESQGVKTVLYAWRDEMADKPRTADEHWRQFARAVKWGKKRGHVRTNPLEDYEALYSSNRADVIWHPNDIQKVLSVTTKAHGQLLRGAIHLGARVSDLRNLKWSDIKENETVYRPSKGRKYNRTARVPHTPFFRALIAEIKLQGRTSIFVFTNTQGQQWSQSAVKSADKRARVKSGLTHLHFHDLRGTAATIKASEGKTAMQIAGMLGWSLNEVETMLNRYVSWNEVNTDWTWAVGE